MTALNELMENEGCRRPGTLWGNREHVLGCMSNEALAKLGKEITDPKEGATWCTGSNKLYQVFFISTFFFSNFSKFAKNLNFVFSKLFENIVKFRKYLC